MIDIPGAPGVDSFDGRSGAVSPAASDYDASQIDNDSSVFGTFVSDALDQLDSEILDELQVVLLSQVFGG